MIPFLTRFFILATVSLFSVAGFAGDLKVTLLRDLNNNDQLIARIEGGKFYSIDLLKLATRDDLSAKEREIIRGARRKHLDKVNLNDLGNLPLTDASEELSIMEILDLLDRGEITLSGPEYKVKEENFEWESSYPPKKIGIKCNNESFLPITKSLAEVSPILSQTLSPAPEEQPHIPGEFRIQIKLSEDDLKKTETFPITKPVSWKNLPQLDPEVFDRFDYQKAGKALCTNQIANALGISQGDVSHARNENPAVPGYKAVPVGGTIKVMMFDLYAVKMIVDRLKEKAKKLREQERLARETHLHG